MKIGQLPRFRFDPFGRISLEFTEEVCESHVLGEATKNVHMVLYAVDNQSRRFQVLADACQVCVELEAKVFVLQMRSTVFG